MLIERWHESWWRSDCPSAFWCSAAQPLCCRPIFKTNLKNQSWPGPLFKKLCRAGDADLKRKVSVLLLLPHLETWQVGVSQDKLVLVLKVLRYRAFNGLAVLLLQREPEHQRVNAMREFMKRSVRTVSRLCLRLVAGRSSGHITHSVLSLHLSTVSNLHL